MAICRKISQESSGSGTSSRLNIFPGGLAESSDPTAQTSSKEPPPRQNPAGGRPFAVRPVTKKQDGGRAAARRGTATFMPPLRTLRQGWICVLCKPADPNLAKSRCISFGMKRVASTKPLLREKLEYFLRSLKLLQRSCWSEQGSVISVHFAVATPTPSRLTRCPKPSWCCER